ncbi:hypothetical protein [Huintestinicola sp.]|uniref:hypothetical protein n=1 Tax=Huintestinicola sp. TaxID=2981661 RepID=UPI003D7E6369
MSYKTERALASNSELKSLLEKVPDTYFDFVLGVMLTFVDDKAGQNKMISFLKTNPNANTDDVSEYENKLLFGY